MSEFLGVSLQKKPYILIVLMSEYVQRWDMHMLLSRLGDVRRCAYGKRVLMQKQWPKFDEDQELAFYVI